MGIALAVAIPLVVILATAEHDRHLDSTQPWVVPARRIGRVVACVVAFVLSTVAVLSLLPGLALVVLAVAAATSPPVRALRDRVVEAPDPLVQTPSAAVEPSPELPPSLVPVAEPRYMSDVMLCFAWRHSYWELWQADSVVEKLSVIMRRQQILEELEARDAIALEAWLASGARASASPERYFDDHRHDHPTPA
ncbi:MULTISPECIES: hypothetical protein [unclassified Pseudactinotalea]|uniref:hypothetical protein n=1 Tax=unclassified Pseudactinotalea TaxID=2649176 RepID=UPI00128DD8C5|nr:MULTISPECIES: hypothetical protein [unclassified Pseudactinotalea]MPV50259.1 hypothetical protein [Pseudactinotalea sp. HY160]QGH70149.1 hypothetical protein GCE65_12000 [Pseudactinotalea sp. HY158]